MRTLYKLCGWECVRESDVGVVYVCVATHSHPSTCCVYIIQVDGSEWRVRGWMGIEMKAGTGELLWLAD